MSEEVRRARRLARYTLWNIIGMAFPMIFALVSIPILIHGVALGQWSLAGIGKERFGALSLVWMLVGYFSIFDLGLGRALTKLVAERLGTSRGDTVGGLFWTAMLLMGVLGLLAGAITLALSHGLAYDLLRISPELRPEAELAFRVAAFGMPVIVATVGLTGTLEACHAFGFLNLVRVPAGSLTFFAPVFVLPWHQSLPAVVAILMVVRVLECVVYAAGCLVYLPAARRVTGIRRAEVIPLLTFGGWMTVTNLTVPLMIQVDRFVVGALRSVEEVAFYATPSEVVVKLLIFARAWVSSLFPTFVAEHAAGERGGRTYAHGMKYLLLLLCPVTIGVCALAPELLHVWLGAEFHARSTQVMQILAIGIFIYSAGLLGAAFLQAAGRPDLSARIHLLEVPIFLLLCIGLTRTYGIAGTALAWVGRAALDAGAMLGLCVRGLPGGAGIARTQAALMVATVLAAAGVSCLPGLAARLATGLAATVLVGWFAWRRALSPVERAELQGSVLRILDRLRGGAPSPR